SQECSLELGLLKLDVLVKDAGLPGGGWGVG
ncbi:hypothetical protein HKBW3S25_01369, partial [Candidatus Hakubella thermalkaliphila]